MPTLPRSLSFLALALSATALFAQDTSRGVAVPSPADHLGRPVGTDFELADWEQVSSYFRLLGDASPHVELERVGETTEGRDFLLATISSADNLANLDAIRANAAILADPRGQSAEELARAVDEGKVVLFISCAMHATETAAPEMGMQLAYLLATSDAEPWRSARENVVTVLAPTLNPDGLDHVVSWYRETVGTPYEASGLLKLYQYYTGHDNNRDWFMLTQNETRIVTEQLYSRWFPQVYWDVHQQGSTRERMFVPPFRDPLNPNLDPGIIAGIDLIGTRALFDLTTEGFQGVSTGVSYDMWWNGGNRNVPVRHNIVGLLTEAASVRIATPLFLPRSELNAPSGLGAYAPSNRFPDPWPGGWWRLSDIIDYELAFARSLYGSLTRERTTWLSNALAASERTVREGLEEAPRAWLLPSDGRDPGATRRLVDVLLRSGVEVHRADAEFAADGRTWPAGTLVVRRDQPYGAHVQDLFELQRYPEGDPPYDVAGWTLPLLLGVRRVELETSPETELIPVTDAASAVTTFRGDPRVATGGARSSWDSDTWVHVFDELEDGRAVTWNPTGESAGLFGELEAEDAVEVASLPRIGLYAPWSGSMDEGWLRWVLDTFDVPYVRVRNEMLRAGDLGAFLDVLLVPSISARQLDRGRSAGSVPGEYTGGLAPEGAVAVEEFVRQGGTLVTLGASSAWAIDLLRLPLVDVTRGAEAGEFSCPGSVLRAIPEEHPWTAGLPDSVALFFSRSMAWREMTGDERKTAGLPAAAKSSRRPSSAPKQAKQKEQADAEDSEDGATVSKPSAGEGPELEVLLRYAPTRVLLSGWAREPERIAGRAAWVRARHGRGRVHLFGFRPQYRGWTQGTFSLVFRAALDAVSER